jgi:uncharacterized heparinase superfamily protein
VERPAKLLRSIRKKVQAVTYGSPLYRIMLDQGPLPERLRVPFADPWPGRAEVGQALIAGQTQLFAEGAVAAALGDETHGWLRDLRAVGTDMARRRAAALINDWIDEQETWHDDSWTPGLLGERLANWLAFYVFYAPAQTPAFEERLIASCARQLRHLMRTLPVTIAGLDSFRAVKGLIYGGATIGEGERAIGLALDLLTRSLSAEILSDGGHIARNPSLLLAVLRALIDIRAALRALDIALPQDLSMAIAKIVPALKFFRHGDGGLALFNGSREGDGLEIETALLLAEGRGRVLRRLPHMGYERLQAGRSLLLIDVGAPPPHPFDAMAHAGLGCFEFSVGRERLIVNCGSPAGVGHEGEVSWRQALAATAAHTALTLADMNACEVRDEGGLGRAPHILTAQRYEQDGASFVEVTHDGYRDRLGAVCQRTLALSSAGDALTGTDRIEGGTGHDATLRFHLHPTVQASLAHDGRSVLLRTPSGSGWRFRAEGSVAVGLESSLYASRGAPRRTSQIRVAKPLRGSETILEWSLMRETTKSR